MTLSIDDKVRLLRVSTQGASDCFAQRVHAPNRDPAHYWRPAHRELPDSLLIAHMAGQIELGTYPMVPTGKGLLPGVWWIGADFDGKRYGSDWESDVQKFLECLVDTGANILVNRSRSGKGAHVRVLFRSLVPAWMARRWMTAYLEESGIVSEFDSGIPTSFDRLCPPQDTLREDPTDWGERRPGNLFGMPMHKGLAVRNGGTLPVAVEEATAGNFEPDGRHWEHLARAVEERAWDEAELRAALVNAPGKNDLVAPSGVAYSNRALTVLQGGTADIALLITRRHCEFLRYFQAGGNQPYELWMALAAELHHFGEAGREAFHELSALDPRYSAHKTQQKWDQTADMRPVRCDKLVHMGWRCPHLDKPRCNGAKTPAYFSERAAYDPL